MATTSIGRLARRGAERSNPGRAPVDPGTLLREARESLGLGLAEVRDRTGVLCKYLEALETMDVARFPDQRSVITASRRYAEVVRVDAVEVCASVLRAWQEQQSGHGQAPPPVSEAVVRRRRHGPSQARADGGQTQLVPSARDVTTPGRRAQGHLGAFTQTAEVPAMIGRPAPAPAPAPQATSVYFADTGAVPVTSRLDPQVRSSRFVRATVAVAAVLLLVALGAAAIQHYKPAWLSDIGLTRHSGPTDAISHTANSTQANSSAASTPSASASPSATSGSSATVVTTSESGPGSESVEVHVSGYSVLVSAQKPCWIDATSAQSGTAPLFAGVLQGGQSKLLDPVDGQMSLEFGASFVTVQVQSKGKAVPGWTFSPHTVPFVLKFSNS